MEAWRKSRLGFQRDLIRYYESLATLELYSRPADYKYPLGAGGTPVGPVKGVRVLEDAAEQINCSIAVIGSGPAGLAAIKKLLRSVFYKGMAASIVEAL